MKCYYHKIGLGGKCSAAIVKRKYPDCELIGVDYPDRPDFKKIKLGDTIFVVDFSFEREDMLALTTAAGPNKVFWIDHHKSAIEKMKGENWLFRGRRAVDTAACELTWEYLFPDEPMPEAVRLLGRYDVWDHEDETVLPFQYGMRLSEWSPEDVPWENILKSNELSRKMTEARTDMGATILDYEYQRNTIYAEEMAFPVEFEGNKAWAINKALSNSLIFETIENSDERPLWILFRYRAGIWKYSLYSAPDSGLDISIIAAKYGGGGHAGAAGFQSEKYLLEEVKL